MWDELERRIDCLFKGYVENGDNSTEATKQLVDCVVESISKLLYPKEGELYYKDASLGFISIEDEEIREWVTDFLEERKRESFQDYLNETIRVVMWYKTEILVDCLIKEYFENSNDYSEEGKKQLVDCAVESIKKLLHLEDEKLYYKGESLGIISIEDEEIREWISGFLRIGVNKIAAKPFLDYLNETIHQVMRNKLVPKIDRLFEKYSEKHDYTETAKEQLVNCAVENIRKLLYPQNGELYYIEKCLGFIYIDDAETRDWVTNYLGDCANGSAAKPFHEYLDDMILQAANLQWKQADNQRRDWGRIKNAANYYAMEYLKEKKSVIRKERENLWTENAQMALGFASKLVIEDKGKYRILGYEFNASLFGNQQSRYQNGISKGELSNEIFRDFLEGYNNGDGAFCGSYLTRCIGRHWSDCGRRRGQEADEQEDNDNKPRIDSLNRPICNDNTDGNELGNGIEYKEKKGDVEGTLQEFVNLTKFLSDFTRIQDSMKGRNLGDKEVKWHRFLVFYIRNYVDEICEVIEPLQIKKINRDIDIIFRVHYRKFKSMSGEIVDYTDCSVCQAYVYCLELVHEETTTERESIAIIRENRPGYVNAIALQKKKFGNELNDNRIQKEYLNKYFGCSNLSEHIQEYEAMIEKLRKEEKLDITSEERDAYLYWLNTCGKACGISDEEELRRYSGQKLRLRCRIISDKICLCYLKDAREGSDQLILTQFPTDNIKAITQGIAQAYRIAVIIFDNIYGEENTLRKAYKSAEDYSRIMRDRIIKKLRK